MGTPLQEQMDMGNGGGSQPNLGNYTSQIPQKTPESSGGPVEMGVDRMMALQKSEREFINNS